MTQLMISRPRSRRISHLVSIVVVALFVACPASLLAEHHRPAATVDDLAWMTGSWSGSAGPGTLEENWTEPKAGSIASLVRMTGAQGTSMIELIVVEEDEGSLTLRLQQWNPGYQPRTEKPQTFHLAELGTKKVAFTAVSEGGMKTLTYSSPAEGKFNIDIVTNQGASFTLELKAME